MEGKMEEMESTERSPAEEKEGWSPAMVSSPEATMLEDTGIKGETEAEGSSRDGGASPLLEERLKPDGDEMHDGAVEGGEKTSGDSAEPSKTGDDAGDDQGQNSAEAAATQ